MNVLVIGAAGKTGKLVVERATKAGHTVTAFVRKMPDGNAASGVRFVTGDATNAGSVADAMAGQDAVIDTVGGKTPFLKSDIEQKVADTALSAMQQVGVRRFIGVSAIGVGESRNQGGFFVKHLLVPIFLRGSTKDKAAMEQRVQQSGLDYVLVRPAILSDDPAAGSVRVVPGKELAKKISRADVAQFLVDQLQSDKYLGHAVTIGGN